jgi:hypothetical protein
MADLFTDVNGEMRDEYPPFHPMDSLGAARFCASDHQRNLSGPPAARVWQSGLLVTAYSAAGNAV